ncbi:hypothetical protein [Dactylosporangium sp. NPDC005555]
MGRGEVNRLRDGEQPFHSWGLSKRQAAAVTTGGKGLLIIRAYCGDG